MEGLTASLAIPVEENAAFRGGRWAWKFGVGVLLVSCLLLVCGCPGNGIRNDTCLVCHNGQNAKDVSAFPNGPHRGLQCERCHGAGYVHVRNGGRAGLFIRSLEGLDTSAERDVCRECHEQEVAGFDESAHAEGQVLSCGGCHDVHAGPEGAPSSENNDMCRRCHQYRGMGDDAAVEAHTFHPVDPSGTGASRCTGCHLPPVLQDGRELGHSLWPTPPERSIEAIDAGIPVPPNSCLGVPGCHDGSVVTAPVFDLEDRYANTLAQILYDSWYGSGQDKAVRAER